jgi:hypothetical protein
MFAAIVFLGDESSVPSQEGLRRNDRGDFAKQAPGAARASSPWPPSVGVDRRSGGGVWLPVARAALGFFAEIVDGVALLLAQRNQQ